MKDPTIPPEMKAAGIICRTKNVECIFYDRGGDLLLITFNEIGMVANGKTFWCESPAKKLNISVVGFVTSYPNWFPEEDTDICISALERVIGNRPFNRVTFGLSQGGYAAIKYSKRLKSRTCISFSPQSSINPEDVQDRRFIKFFRPEIHSTMVLCKEDTSGEIFVFYDPYNSNDADHYRSIAHNINVHEIKIPFAGHGSIRPFVGTATIKTLIDACILRDERILYRLYKEIKVTSPDRPYFMALALSSRRPRVALQIFKRYCNIRPNSRWIHVCYRLAKSGLGREVIDWLRSFSDGHENDHEAHSCVSLVALDLRDANLAVDYIQRALNCKKNDPKYLHILDRIQRLQLLDLA
jgi:hypothetical protein